MVPNPLTATGTLLVFPIFFSSYGVCYPIWDHLSGNTLDRGWLVSIQVYT